MKKLSIEEKAKAYDKAREKIAVRFGTNVAEEIFSEFEESEDERIRKEIIQSIKGNMVVLHKAKCIAWLEKQAEQKQKQYDIDVLEKHITKDSISELAHTVIVRNGWEIVDAKESQNYWSEENENTIKVLMNIIKRSETIDPTIYTDSLKEKLYDWLKSLKEKFKIQTRQGIGKEDEYSFMIISGLIRQDQDISPKDKNKLRLWLKSIIYQSHWKPSDEQMKQLGWIAEQNKDNMIGKELISLYQDLKKLREE